MHITYIQYILQNVEVGSLKVKLLTAVRTDPNVENNHRKC